MFTPDEIRIMDYFTVSEFDKNMEWQIGRGEKIDYWIFKLSKNIKLFFKLFNKCNSQSTNPNCKKASHQSRSISKQSKIVAVKDKIKRIWIWARTVI